MLKNHFKAQRSGFEMKRRRKEAREAFRFSWKRNKADFAATIWGCSSAGRAPALQAGGQEFDPPHLHQRASEDENDDRRREPNGLVAQVVRAYA